DAPRSTATRAALMTFLLDARLLMPRLFVEAREVVEIGLDARRILDDPLVGLHRHPRIQRPRTGEDVRILDRRLVLLRVADARDPLGDLHLVAVEPAVDSDPRLVDEALCFDDE